MGSKKSGLMESLSDKCIMQSCTSFLRGFSSRLRVEDSDSSYLDLCARSDKAVSRERLCCSQTVNAICLKIIIFLIFFYWNAND